VNERRQWTERAIHGGSLFQSSIQAICRDLLVESQLRLEQAGFPVNMSVHDETASVVPASWASRAEEFCKIMTQVPEWTKGFPIGADGWVGARYKK
jgi:DNA polymerase